MLPFRRQVPSIQMQATPIFSHQKTSPTSFHQQQRHRGLLLSCLLHTTSTKQSSSCYPFQTRHNSMYISACDAQPPCLLRSRPPAKQRISIAKRLAVCFCFFFRAPYHLHDHRHTKLTSSNYQLQQHVCMIVQGANELFPCSPPCSLTPSI